MKSVSPSRVWDSLQSCHYLLETSRRSTCPSGGAQAWCAKRREVVRANRWDCLYQGQVHELEVVRPILCMQIIMLYEECAEVAKRDERLPRENGKP